LQPGSTTIRAPSGELISALVEVAIQPPAGSSRA